MPKLTRRSLTTGLLASLPVQALTASGAAAAARAGKRLDPIIERLPLPGTDIKLGVGRIVVHAPLAAVRAQVQRYNRYEKIFPRLSSSRIVGRKRGQYTDVYMRARILRGVAHIWGVMRFSEPARWANKGEKVTARYVDGNLDDFRGTWYMYPCGPNRTTLRLELFLDPSIFVPASVVNEWLGWGAGKAVSAVRDMAECGRSTVAKD